VGLGAFFLYKQLAARDQNDRQILLSKENLKNPNKFNSLSTYSLEK
jgi:hypothetical protein